MRKTDMRIRFAAGIGRLLRGSDSGGVSAATRTCGVLATGLALLATLLPLQAGLQAVAGGSEAGDLW